MRNNYSMAKTRTFGIVTCATLFLLSLVCNWYAAQWPGSLDPGEESFLVWATIGCLFGQLAAISNWVVLSSATLIQRIWFYLFATIPLMTSLLIGYLNARSQNESLFGWDHRDIYVAISAYVIAQVGAMIPFLFVRWTGHSIGQKERDGSTRGFSIGAILVATTFAAVFVASEQAGGLFSDEALSTKAIYYSVCMAISLTVSIFFACPLVAFLYRDSFLKGIWKSTILTSMLLAVTLFLVGFAIHREAPLLIVTPNPYQFGLLLSFATFLLTQIWFALGLRSLGYRLHRSERQKESLPDAGPTKP